LLVRSLVSLFLIFRGVLAPAAGAARIYLTPATVTAAPGQEFTIDLMVDAGSQPVAAVDAFLDFNPTYLRVWGIVPDVAALPTVLISTFDNTSGQIAYSVGKALTGDDATGTFRLATIRLQAVGTTTGTQMAFAFQPPLRNTDIFYQGQSVFGSATNASVRVRPFQLPLQAGWNLVSMPLVPAVPSLPGLLGSIAPYYASVSAYNCNDQADPWKQHTGAGGDLTALTEKQGVWIQMSRAATLSITGTIPFSTSIPLCQGWNLVGYPAHDERSLATALASISGKYERVMSFDAAAGDWQSYNTGNPSYANTLTMLQPGRGYWIWMNQAAVLTIDY
jgi:hypothetical protein